MSSSDVAASNTIKRFLQTSSFRRTLSHTKHTRGVNFSSPFVPSSLPCIHVFCSEFLEPFDVVLDLGCGDGRVVGTAVEWGFGTVTGVGVEVLQEQLGKAKRRFPFGVDWIGKDFFGLEVKGRLNSVSLVFMFLLPEVQKKLSGYLAKELRVGARIVCFTFELLETEGFVEGFVWEPSKVVEVPGLPQGACELREYVVDERVKRSLQGDQ